MTNNQKYWTGRQEQKLMAGEQLAVDYYKKLEAAFQQAKLEVQSVINKFYTKYSLENQVSFTAAQKMLNNQELGELKDFIARVYETMGEYDQRLNNMSIKSRLTRYQGLEKQIDAITQQLYTINYELTGKEALKGVYSDSYYRTWYNIDTLKGAHQAFAQVDPLLVNELINYPFNGATFSDRLWRQKDDMLFKLNQSITTMLVQGKNPYELSKDFAKTFDVKQKEAYRLLYTESTFIMEQATQDAYLEDGVERYQVVATLDMKTSETCREQDGEVYKLEDSQVGVNCPPFHMWCRSVTIPFYPDVVYETRVARGEDGKTYEVPADLTYRKWYNKYIDK